VQLRPLLCVDKVLNVIEEDSLEVIIHAKTAFIIDFIKMPMRGM